MTGIVVNVVLRVPREARRRFRAILNNCRKFGLESQARGRPRFADYLRGFASYVHTVYPEPGHHPPQPLDRLSPGGSSGTPAGVKGCDPFW